MNCRLVSFTILLCLLISAATLSAQEKSAEEIFQLAAAVPEKIERGEFVIQSHFQRFDNPVKDLTTTFRIAFDGEKVRVERENAGRLTVSSSVHEDEEQIFFFESEPKNLIRRDSQFANLPEPNFSSLLFYAKDDYVKLAISEFSEDKCIPNVHSMGFLPCSITFQAIPYPDIPEYLPQLLTRGSSDLSSSPSITLGQENFMGSNCVSVTISKDSRAEMIREILRLKNEGTIKFYDGNGGVLASPPSDEEIVDSIQKTATQSQRKFLFDPVKNYALRFEVNPSPLAKNRFSIQNELSQDSASGLWYPSHWIYERYQQDKLVEREENFLEVVSINQPIDPELFAPGSIESLVPSTPVIWKLNSPPPAEGKLVWDGQKIVGLSDYKFGVSQNTSHRWFIILVNVAGISAIIASLCFRAWRRQQS